MSQTVTLKDIAREANLSVGAVSKALTGYPHISEATRRRVQRISTQLNYKPRSQRRAATGPQQRRIKLVFTERHATVVRYSASFLPALSDAAAAANVRLELGRIPEDGEHSCFEQLSEGSPQLDGVLVLGWVDQGTIEPALRQFDLPCVIIGDVVSSSNVHPVSAHRVDGDKLSMARSATEYLIERGHRRIGFFCSPYPPGGWNEQWLLGHRLALINAGLPDDPALHPVLETNDRDEVGVDAAEYMAALDDPPTAYVVPTVHSAARFLSTMNTLGHELGPEQLVMGGHREEAVGYGLGDYPLFAQPVAPIAVRALDLLLRLVDGEPLPPAQVLVPFEVHNVAPNAQG